MTNHFDIMAVRRNHKGGVVTGVIIGTQARPAVIFTAGRQRRLVKIIHLPAAVGDKCQMQLRRLRRGLVQAQ